MSCAEVLIITISLAILCLNCDRHMRISVENVFLSSWEQICVEFEKVKKGSVFKLKIDPIYPTVPYFTIHHTIHLFNEQYLPRP